MRAWPVLGVALWGACEDPPTDTNPATDTGPTLTEPSPYLVDAQEDPEPSESLASIEAALQRAIDLTMTVNAAPVRAAYEEVMAHQGGGCPYYYATQDGNYWLSNCSSPSGARYDGFVFGLESGDVKAENGFVYNTWYASGGATVMDPTGDLFELGGVAALQTVTGMFGKLPYLAHTSVLQGSFQWSGASAAGTFLDEGIDPDLQIALQQLIGLGGTNTLTGGFSGFDGGWAVAFDENLIFSATLQSACEDEVAGTVAVRSPAGEWYDVRFDGPTEQGQAVPAADCDGCGTAWFHGAEVGEICVDFSSLLDFGVNPW